MLFFFTLFTQENLIMLSTPLEGKSKEGLGLCRNTIQGNGKGTGALSHFVSAARTTL